MALTRCALRRTSAFGGICLKDSLFVWFFPSLNKIISGNNSYLGYVTPHMTWCEGTFGPQKLCRCSWLGLWEQHCFKGKIEDG